MDLAVNHKIDSRAVIHKGAEIDSDVSIGPYAVIGENVKIGRGTVIDAHATIHGWTEIGENCRISSGAVLGDAPQSYGYKGERTYVRIGNNNIIREFVTVHRSAKEEETTRIGDDNFLMAYVHVGHDCLIGNQTTITSYVAIAGHVIIEDKAIIGGMTAIHQFVRLGTLSMTGGVSRAIKDVPPYFLASGNPTVIQGLNVVGLRRAGIKPEVRTNLKKAYHIIYRSGLNVTQAVQRIREEMEVKDEIAHLVQFIEESERGICAGRK